MCMSCGCNRAHDAHDGDSRRIVYEDLAAAAKADGITVNDVVKNINSSVISDRVKHEDEYTEKP